MALSSIFFFPLAQQIEKQSFIHSAPLFLGINGAQGTGKSTLAALLKCMLESGTDKQCAILSIDDLYFTQAKRKQLAENIHPLLKVRGVPGTHDIELGLSIIDQLLTTNPTLPIALPYFNKAIDDRMPHSQWPHQTLPVDILILEGWCVGARPQLPENLLQPINSLEDEQDKNCIWRNFVNQELATQYQQLFDKLDALIMLKAPSMEAIEDWRWLQEQKLIAATKGQGQGLMSQEQVKYFIQHYERLTRHILEEMPARADLVFHLNNDHQIESATGHLTAGITQ
jgi:D-glycerate 3-kinase